MLGKMESLLKSLGKDLSIFTTIIHFLKVGGEVMHLFSEGHS